MFEEFDKVMKLRHRDELVPLLNEDHMKVEMSRMFDDLLSRIVRVEKRRTAFDGDVEGVIFSLDLYLKFSRVYSFLRRDVIENVELDRVVELIKKRKLLWCLSTGVFRNRLSLRRKSF